MRPSRYFSPVLLSLVLAAFTAPARGDSSVIELLRASKGQAKTISAEDVAQAKAGLLEAVQNLEALLAETPADQAATLRELVQLDAMRAELEKDSPSVEVLNRSLVKYREDAEGLEQQAFTAVRSSLRDYMNRLVFSATEKLADEYDRRIDELTALLEAYEKAPTTKQAVAIGRVLGWFERAEQIGSVTSAIRGSYSHPNLYVSASSELLASSVRDTVNATEPLRDCILGTSIHGTTHLEGNVDLNLVPSDEFATFDITMIGNAVSNNVGYNRGVTIHSNAYTNVNATKRTYFDVDGVTADGATATASTSSNVSSVLANSRLVQKIAWKRVRQSKSQAEQIASRRAASRVAGRVDTRAGESLAEADASFQDNFRAPLIRRDSFPEVLKIRTTDSRLFAQLLRAGRFQFAAPGPAPEIEGEFDFAARVHESVVGNFSESMIGGLMLTDERIVEMYEEAGVEVPPDLVLSDDSEPWAITFSRNQPISVEFSNGGVKVAVLCQTLHQGEEYDAVKLLLRDKETDKAFRPDIRISREYDLTTLNEGGLQLVATGDLNVDLVDASGKSHPYGLTQSSAVGLLKNKFGAMLKPKLPEDAGRGLTFNDRWARLGTLKARLANAAEGWLSIGWEQILDEASAAADPVARADDDATGTGDAQQEPVADLAQTASAAP